MALFWTVNSVKYENVIIEELGAKPCEGWSKIIT